MTSPPPKIAIVGAGPVGCTFARLLHLASIDFTIFEAESSPNYRSQGGTLDLHTSTGLAALKAANLFTEFLACARYDGHHIQFTDRMLKSYLTMIGPPVPKEGVPRSKLEEQRPEIDRSDLRRILAESVPADRIRWGWKVDSVRLSEDGNPLETLITFREAEHAPEKGFALIVGADGAFSKTRGAVSEQKPLFSRIALWELSVPDAEKTAPEVKAAVKGGSIFAHAEGRRISVQQMGDGSLSVGIVERQEDADWARKEKCGYDAADLETVKKRLLEGKGALFGEDWHPLMREAVQKAEGRCIPRSLWQMPVGFKWQHRQGVTLIGDAAHVMTPFAGEGVNVGMADSMNLASRVVKALKGEGGGGAEALDAAVKDYETEMWSRSEKVARLSDQLAKLYMFEPNTPKSIIARTTALHAKADLPGVVHPVVDATIHGLFLFKRMTGGTVTL